MEQKGKPDLLAQKAPKVLAVVPVISISAVARAELMEGLDFKANKADKDFRARVAVPGARLYYKSRDSNPVPFNPSPSLLLSKDVTVGARSAED